MSEASYTLEWRGGRKGPWTFQQIEEALAEGAINSLYHVHVDGKWLVLRDFLEQQRAALALARKQAQAAALTQPLSHLKEQTSQPTRRTAPLPPPLPPQPTPALIPAFRDHAPQPSKTAGGKWWTVLISVSAMVIILAAVAGGYLFAHRSSGEERKPKSTTKGTPEIASDDEPAIIAFHPDSISGKDFFPSAIISTATVDWNGEKQTAEDKKTEDDTRLRKGQIPLYGDENGWVGIRLEGITKGSEVSAEISMDGFMKPSKWHGALTKVTKEGTAIVYPKILWDYEALLKVRQQRPANITYKVSVNGLALPEVTETNTIKSINDCPLFAQRDDEEGGVECYSFLFASYVNENHPFVGDIRKEALLSGLVEKFDGYQSQDPKQVMLQVFAIWNALQRRGIRYSDIASTAPGNIFSSQSVRFLDESIDTSQANCVDGSVLMASILHSIGIRSYLVLIPGHCFLAFDTNPGGQGSLPQFGLETTMLGLNNLTPVKQLDFLPSQQKLKEVQDSVNTFVEAKNTGTKNISKYASKLGSAADVRYKLISISAARSIGITPIAFTKDAK